MNFGFLISDFGFSSHPPAVPTGELEWGKNDQFRISDFPAGLPLYQKANWCGGRRMNFGFRISEFFPANPGT